MNDITAEESLYQAQAKIYPREVSGRFQNLRVVSVFALLGLYYVLPWINWGERQAILFDLPARKFHVFGLTLWPQDLFYLTALLITAALTLFFFTALFGRVYCGYACPQTVWTEVFIWLERWTEGPRHIRMKLDKAPWSANKLMRKSAKHFLWIAFAFLTGFTFVGYFSPISDLAGKILSLSLGGWATFFILFFTVATYANAGFMREQVCKYMCPYARFQSSMFDHDTLIVAYDDKRGEPRGRRRRTTDRVKAGLGDCIECSKCVQVCPTGIDIREGLQYECIACAACIDVCDTVMDTMGYDPGLIRYTTEHAITGKQTRVLRPRILVYSALLLAVVSLTAFSLVSRTPLGLDIIRDRNSLYRVVDEGRIENVYSLRIMNKDQSPHRFAVNVLGPDNMVIETDPSTINVEAGAIAAVAARISAPPEGLSGGQDIRIEISAIDDSKLTVVEPTRFMAPLPRQ